QLATSSPSKRLGSKPLQRNKNQVSRTQSMRSPGPATRPTTLVRSNSSTPVNPHTSQGPGQGAKSPMGPSKSPAGLRKRTNSNPKLLHSSSRSNSIDSPTNSSSSKASSMGPTNTSTTNRSGTNTTTINSTPNRSNSMSYKSSSPSGSVTKIITTTSKATTPSKPSWVKGGSSGWVKPVNSTKTPSRERRSSTSSTNSASSKETSSTKVEQC
ncbi:unnamed protein product, partial [Owenia fusiformis]